MTFFGKNLHSVIHAKARDNWKAFASWFSLKRFLPDSEISLVCDLDDVPFEHFTWAKKLNMKHYFRRKFRKDEWHNRLELLSQLPAKPTLLISSNVIMVDMFTPTKNLILNEELVYLNPYDKNCVEKIIDDYVISDKLNKDEEITCDAKSELNRSFISIRKGCGLWINTHDCPFRDNQRHERMTINEVKIISMLEEMITTYDLLN